MGKSKDIQKLKAKAKTKVVKETKKQTRKDDDGSQVVFTDATFQSFCKSVPRQNCITVNNVCSQFGISRGLAKLGLKKLEQDGKIVAYQTHSKLMIWVPTEEMKEEMRKKKEEKKEEKKEDKKGKKGSKKKGKKEEKKEEKEEKEEKPKKE